MLCFGETDCLEGEEDPFVLVVVSIVVSVLLHVPVMFRPDLRWCPPYKAKMACSRDPSLQDRVREASVALARCMGSFGQSRGVLVLHRLVDTAEVHAGKRRRPSDSNRIS
jgi:hypothetical protein